MIFTMEIGKIIPWMDTGLMSLFLGKSIKDVSKWVAKMDMENVLIKMEGSMKECGPPILK